MFAADCLVNSATCLAQRLNVSTAFMGLTIVALGTSAPEIVVSLASAIDGNADVGIGNTIGSNIANIGLVLGLTALVTVPLSAKLMKQQAPLLFVVMATTYLLLKDSHLGRR